MRATRTWECLVSASSRTSLLTTHYQAYLADQDTAAFITRIASRYTSGTLERLATHGDREIRRAAVLALGSVGDYESNRVLGLSLADEDRTVLMLAESGIRNVWRRAGSEAYRQQLAIVIRLNNGRQYHEAIPRATELIEMSPGVAEGWNQRAIAYYSTGRYTEAIRDCQQALEINPYHFDAAAGMGQCYLQAGDEASALECLRRALRLNPGLEGVRAGVEYLERSLRRQ